MTTDNELTKYIAVYYTLCKGGISDERRFCMRCENVETNHWSYKVIGCTKNDYNVRFLKNVPQDNLRAGL